MISVVIPYYNKRKLLINTLKSIEFFGRNVETEIIIVDDGSDEGIGDISLLFPSLNIILITLTKDNPGWRAPAIAYNTGFNIAKGEVILLNSCDCLHIGYLLKYVEENMNDINYLCFSTLAAMEQLNTFLDSIKWEDATSYFITKEYGFQNGWWRSHKTNPTLIPFCASISRTNLEKLNGYDERFTKGIGFDDCDFIDRVANLGLNMVLVDYPYCVHQYHELVQYTNDRNAALLQLLVIEEPHRIKAPENEIYVK